MSNHRVSSTVTECRGHFVCSPSIENRHRVWRYRVPPPNTEYRGSSTVTECRGPSTECSEYRVPSPSVACRVSSTVTEYRVPSPSIEYHHRVSKYRHRVWKYRVPSPCRVPSTEYRVPSPSRTVTEYGSIEYRVPNTERSVTECREPSPSIEVWSTVSHRGSSTVTEWRVPSTEYRVTNIETRINMSSSRITENGVPSNEQQTISANIASIVRSSVQSDSNLETRKNV